MNNTCPIYFEELHLIKRRTNYPSTPIVNSPWFKSKTPNISTLLLDLQREFNYQRT